MKKKKKKFESLKSILILLQQIQANEFGTRDMVIRLHIDEYGDEFVTSSIYSKNEKMKIYYFYSNQSAHEREYEYNRILQFIKDN